MNLFPSVYVVLIMMILYNCRTELEAQNVETGIDRNARIRRLTVPLTGNLNAWQQQAQVTYYGLPYVRSPWDNFSIYRNYLLTGWPLYSYGYPLRVPTIWHASSKLTGDEGVAGVITFQQIPYSNQIKVTLNGTGLPAGKHALHIHTFGDLSDGCQSTGGQFTNTFLGNVEAKEDGSVSVVFLNMFLNLFGYNGIIGRSIVIHENPIDLNTALNVNVYSAPVPDVVAFQNEEKSVGKSIACGIISITNVQQQQEQPQEEPPPAEEK